MPEVVFVVGLGGAVVVIGIVVGMLAAPRLQRWVDRSDEEPGDAGD